MREYNRKYRETEWYKNYQKEYKKRNRDKLREQDRLTGNARRKAQPERYRASYRKQNLLRRYGLTPDEYQEIYARQKGRCAICTEEETALSYQKNCPQRLAIDHNHTTQKVRGLLCFSCNRGIGYLKDSTGLLIAALMYLEENDG